jgi:hypothetical protein
MVETKRDNVEALLANQILENGRNYNIEFPGG